MKKVDVTDYLMEFLIILHANGVLTVPFPSSHLLMADWITVGGEGDTAGSLN